MKERDMAAVMQPFPVCPKCGGFMESGFLATQQRGGGFFAGGLKCSKILWTQTQAMGFFGSPKGEDVTTRNAHRKYVFVPAQRCPACRLLVFEY
jgi:hypothetical protein